MKTSLYLSRILLIVLSVWSINANAETDIADTRTVINVDTAAKAYLLQEMRQLLENVQLIFEASLKKDMDSVNKYASNLGMQSMKATPSYVSTQLPQEFKLMGRGIHEAMDNIARDARDLGDSQRTLEQLNTTLQSCVACHQAFKF